MPILGGHVTGGAEAEILPCETDWQIVRPDGTIEIDSRYSARTPDGALPLLQAKNSRTGNPSYSNAYGRVLTLGPREYYFRMTVTVETAVATLADLQRHRFVATACRQSSLAGTKHIEWLRLPSKLSRGACRGLHRWLERWSSVC